MSEKRSKYDTDPLDPDFVRRTEEAGGPSGATDDVGRERPTRPQEARDAGFGEEPTRRLEDPFNNSYPSVFVPPVYQPPPANYTSFGNATPPANQATAAPRAASGPKTPPTSRTVVGLGLPENLAMVLPYTPFYIGLVASLVELILVPRSEHRVRFHAAQGLSLQLAILGITFLFGIVRMVTGTGLGGWLFWLAALVFLIVSMLRVWQGEEHRIAPLDEATRRINQQFEPRK